MLAMARTLISVTELVSHPERSPSKSVCPEKSSDMSSTLLVSQVEMLPYVASAASAESELKYSLTACTSSSLVVNWNGGGGDGGGGDCGGGDGGGRWHRVSQSSDP